MLGSTADTSHMPVMEAVEEFRTCVPRGAWTSDPAPAVRTRKQGIISWPLVSGCRLFGVLGLLEVHFMLGSSVIAHTSVSSRRQTEISMFFHGKVDCGS